MATNNRHDFNHADLVAPNSLGDGELRGLYDAIGRERHRLETRGSEEFDKIKAGLARVEAANLAVNTPLFLLSQSLSFASRPAKEAFLLYARIGCLAIAEATAERELARRATEAASV